MYTGDYYSYWENLYKAIPNGILNFLKNWIEAGGFSYMSLLIVYELVMSSALKNYTKSQIEQVW